VVSDRQETATRSSLLTLDLSQPHRYVVPLHDHEGHMAMQEQELQELQEPHVEVASA